MIRDVAVAHWMTAATEEQRSLYSWIVVRHEIDYKKPAYEGEEITVSTWVGEWTTVTCERFTEIHCGEDLLVKGRTVWCMVERETMRPERISKELIERFVCGSRIDGGKTVFFLLKLFRMYLNRSASYLTSLIAVVLFLIVFGGITTYSQACQQIGNIEIRLQDENEKPVRNASIKFINIPDGAPLDDHEFTEYRESFGSLYVGRYCESEIVGKEGKNGFTRSYDVSVSAKGYRDVKTKISIYHCLGQCLVNRAFVTIVGESAKLVTIKGTVKISLPAGYSEKGRLSSSEKIVSGAPIKFKRSAMTEFSTTSDADGNFQITVPQGSYSVYASANLNCVLCAEYFGNVVGRSETTVLNIVLRFYGEG